jgi:hypothetical protein
MERSCGGITDGSDDKRMTASCKERNEALIEHHLFGKPLHTFPDHALAQM